VDGIAYPLCSRQARGHDFLSGAVLSHRVAIDDGALLGGARPLNSDICGGVEYLGTCIIYVWEICLWDTPHSWFSLKTLFVMLLSVGHCNFVFLVYGTCAVSPGQIFSSFFVCGTLCGVSHTNSQNYNVPQTKI
jgi:hypothetical protein